MTDNKSCLFCRILSVATAVSIAAAALCLMAGCLLLYTRDTFTPEAVAEAFAPISIPVYLCLGLSLLSLLSLLFIPESRKTLRNQNQEQLLQKLQLQRDLTQSPEALCAGVQRQRRLRSRLRLLSLLLTLLLSAIFLGYALNGGNFDTREINRSMIRAMAVLAPCFLLWGLWWITAGYHRRKSVAKEIELLKQAPVADNLSKQTPAKDRHFRILPLVILAIALSALLYGFFTGGTIDVLTKAVNICTECVGLG